MHSQRILSLLILLSVAFSGLAQQNMDCYLADKDAGPRQSNIDMQRMVLDVTFEPKAGKVLGQVRYDFSPVQKTVDSIFLDAPGITIEAVKLDNKRVDFETNSEGLIIRPEKALSWETDHTLWIDYEATPRKGIYFIGWNDPNNKSRKQIWTQGQGIDNRHWIPSFDDMSDKLLTEIKVTFDEEYEVLSNGELVKEKKQKDGTRYWHYRMTQPHAPYLVMLAIGNYAIAESKTESGVKVNNWYYPDMPETVKPTYRYTADMIDYMEEEFGVAYPWHEYSQVPVQDFMYGAMENTTATIFGDFYVMDERQFLDYPYISTNAHELVHQWFGDYITGRGPTDIWLQESFATHYQKHFERSIFGEDHFQWNRRGEMRSAWNAAKSNDNPIVHTDAGSARIYPKGSLVLDMLRYMLGNEQYRKVITWYLKKHAYDNVDTHQFYLAFYEVLGVNLDWFFDQWLYRGGEPHYEVSYQDIEKNGERLTQIDVKQAHERTDLVGLFRMPIVFEVHYADGSSDSKKVWIEEQYHTVNIPNEGNKEIDFVLFDPNSWIIKTVDFKKGWDELKAQSLKAPNMIDRYDAVKAMRDLPMDDKKAHLIAIFEGDDFYEIRAEAVRQLMEDIENLDEQLVKAIVNDPSRDVRFTAIQQVESFPAQHLEAFETLLNDSSYNVVEWALVKLWRENPDKAEAYMQQTKGDIGRGSSVKVRWLEIGVHVDRDKYLSQLVAMTGNSYEFLARRNAMDALERLNHLDEEAIGHMINAMFNPNKRLANPAKNTLKHFYDQNEYRRMITDHINERTYEDWQMEILQGADLL